MAKQYAFRQTPFTKGVGMENRYKGGPIHIQFGLQKCKFLTPYPKTIRSQLACKIPGYIFMPQYRAGGWDGSKHFITANHYFPTGLAPVVYALLRTGKNPIGKDKDKQVIKVLPSRIKFVFPGNTLSFFSWNFIRSYTNKVDILDSLQEEKHTFTIPLKTVKNAQKNAMNNEMDLRFLEAIIDFLP